MTSFYSDNLVIDGKVLERYSYVSVVTITTVHCISGVIDSLQR